MLFSTAWSFPACVIGLVNVNSFGADWSSMLTASGYCLSNFIELLTCSWKAAMVSMPHLEVEPYTSGSDSF